MIKRFAFLFAIGALFYASIGNAQIEEDRLSFSLSYSSSVLESPFDKHVAGIDIEYHISDLFGLNYSLALSENSVHVPAGLLATIVIFAYAPQDLDVALYSILIPEGVTINVPLMDNFYFSPYLNPLGFEYYWDGEKEDDLFLMGDFGIRIKAFIRDNFVVSTKFGMQQDYFNASWDAKAGINLGILF